MGKCSRKDNISDLPQNIIEKILTKIPIRDAVKTSILSKKWRYQWTTMTQLVFGEIPNGTYDERKTAEKKLANFMTQFLLLHDGPIHKFKVTSSYLTVSTHIDQWLRVISRKDVEELLIGKYWNCPDTIRTPSHIFLCQQLTRLKLCKFEVKPPLKFQGFPCLKYLNLRDCTVALEVIENLISGCPLLEKFKFENSDGLALSVRAPNLKYLCLDGNFRDVYLEHTPSLVSLSLLFFKDWEDSILVKVPVTYDSIKVIELGGINFEVMNAVLFALQLILQSPNLQELRIIEASSRAHHQAADSDFWEKQCPTDFTFKHLKVVKMMDVSNEHEIKFLKFVLERSPLLETMSVSPPCHSREQMNMVNQVLRVGQAFPNVDIKFLDHY
ncbi:F-box/FBD/LRR-repeat protein [Heracleum sosnowskyi]|uniref:F-box/FBD/LRR-repeat protein n=1 Tax=Heracleum sosnowskyi TaxID=360622 RepID=A0AAD8HX34_9APIA|nr:F-box/FBD/LRR-repeat protein [Heracleum sosnowskyi]